MGVLIRIDDFKQDQQRAILTRNNPFSEQYRIIGETLSISEVVTIRVGVPWLPPGQKQKELSKQYHGPLEDFIRSSLVSVSTETLDHYCEDLNSFATEPDNNDSLYIPSLCPAERFFFCLVVFLILFTTSLALGLLLGSTRSATLTLSIITSIPAALLAAFPCMEIQRRSSFYYFLNKELNRRRGASSPGSGKAILNPNSSPGA